LRSIEGQARQGRPPPHGRARGQVRELTRSALGVPLIIWPEAAPPDLANELVDYLLDLYREGRRHGSALVIGVVRASDDGQSYYNSVLSLAASGTGWYDKHHLVPFAEFFPVPSFVRTWLRLASLPYSDFTRGAEDQPPLSAAGLSLATLVTTTPSTSFGAVLALVLPAAAL